MTDRNGKLERVRWCRRRVMVAAPRIALSCVRRSFSGLSIVIVTLRPWGIKIRADLRTGQGLRLYRYGLRDPEMQLLSAILGPGDVFVDAGAHIGTYSLVAAAAVGREGRVIACEPEPAIADLLFRNVRLNGFDWVEPHVIALAETTGQRTFLSFGPGSGTSSFAPHCAVGAVAQQVALTTLDNLLQPYIGRIKLIKLDIEGAEVHALRGARTLLTEGKPDLIVEVEPAHLKRQGSSLAELHSILEAAGYRAYQIGGDSRAVKLVPVPMLSAPTGGNPNMFFSTARPERVLMLSTVAKQSTMGPGATT